MENASAGLMYFGSSDVTQECVDAVSILIQTVGVKSALVLTHKSDTGTSHGLLLNLCSDRQLVIPPGFTSGYRGTGPRGLSYTLSLLESFKVTSQEVEISEEIFERLRCKNLLLSDLLEIEKLPRRGDRIFGSYVFQDDAKDISDGGLWRELDPILPLALVAAELKDLAIDFYSDPDRSIFNGYRRLEDSVRRITGSKEISYKLMAVVFNGEKSLLTWEGIEPGEHNGRAQLFTGAYMAFRNSRAHREPKLAAIRDTQEFLLLSLLFALLGGTIPRQLDETRSGGEA